MSRKMTKTKKMRPGGGNRLIIVGLIAVFLVAGVFIGNSISGYYTYRIEEDTARIPSLSTDDFTEVSVSIEPAIIYLTGACRQILMVTTLEQTASIDMALRRMQSLRPLAHDIMTKQMKVFGIEILMVKVHTLEEGAYYADIIFRQNNKVLEMDARPSDAIALAIRMNAPIYVSNDLMEDQGEAVC